MSNQPYAGGYERSFATGNIQLSYDIMSADGRMIYSGSVIHPVRERMEVFESPEGTNIHREGKIKPAVFSLKVPSIREASSIRFYEAPADADLTTTRGREQRKFLEEIKIQ